jgi:hypothetical protein
MNKELEALDKLWNGNEITGKDYLIVKNAIKRNTPMKVKKDIGGEFCPRCEFDSFGMGAINYCPQCGQKLDWSEFEDE